MRHLSDTSMRRAVDDPLTLRPRERDHLDACSRCADAMRQIHEDARFAAQVFAAPAPSVDARSALGPMTARVATESGPSHAWRAQAGAWFQYRSRRANAGWALAAAAALMVGSFTLTPAGSLAQSFIDIFQPQDVASVSVTTADLHSMLQLRHYGNVHPPRTMPNRTVADADAAGSATSMHVLTPATLPAGIPRTASYTVISGTSGSFTFSASKARAWAAKHGKTLAAMPQGLDGSTLTVTTGNGVVATYKESGGSIPGLIVGQMRAPRVSTTGVSVATMETYVLHLPNVPTSFANEIQALGDPRKTLVLPVPVDFASAHMVQVHGSQGYAIGDNTGLGSVVIWEQSGVIYGVGGPMSESQALQIADSLQ